MSRNIVFKLPVICAEQESRHAVVFPETYPFAVTFGDADDMGLTSSLFNCKPAMVFDTFAGMHIDDCIKLGEEIYE